MKRIGLMVNLEQSLEKNSRQSTVPSRAQPRVYIHDEQHYKLCMICRYPTFQLNIIKLTRYQS